MASNLKEVTKQLKSGGAISELNQTMKNLNAVTEKVKNGEGTIGALFADASSTKILKKMLLAAPIRNKVLKFFVRQAVKSTDEANKDKEKDKK